ncbi:MAG: serine/threonine-protein phosphatase [Proteobacteria bacterium]|nr:serine/threonine-protein phosphatase [Pseudomonadota bacterium]
MNFEEKIIVRNAKIGEFGLRSILFTDVGLQRSENQDSFGYAVSANSQINIVADGMGGARGGGTASAIAIKNILESVFDEKGLISEDSLTNSIIKTNEFIYNQSKQDPQLNGMGTTLVSLVVTPEKIFSVHVGDSRVYHLSNSKIRIVTKDHTLVQELIDSGALQEGEASAHPISHMLTRSVGPAPTIKSETTYLDKVTKGDKILLCSDGLYNHLQPEIIERILNKRGGEDAIKQLVEFVLNDGASDNFTIELIEVVAPDESDFVPEIFTNGEIKKFIFSEIDLDKGTKLESVSVANSQKPHETKKKDAPIDNLFQKIEKDLEERRNILSVEDKNEAESLRYGSLSTEKLISVLGGMFLVMLSVFLYFREPKIISKQKPTVISEISKITKSENSEITRAEALLKEKEFTNKEILELKENFEIEVPKNNQLLVRKIAIEPLVREANADGEMIAKQLMLANDLAVPTAPKISLGGVKSETSSDVKPVDWEAEKLLINKIINGPVVEEEKENATKTLRTVEENSKIAERKLGLRDKISDLDFKIELLMVDTQKQVEPRRDFYDSDVETVAKAIEILRKDLDIYQKNLLVWRELNSQLEKQSPFKVADNASQVSQTVAKAREEYTEMMETYFAVLDKWQTNPQDRHLSEELASLGKSLKEKKLYLESLVKNTVKSELETVDNNILKTKFYISQLQHRKDTINRRIGYLKSFTVISSNRKRDFQKNYLDDRKKLYAEYMSLRNSFSDQEEMQFRLQNSGNS